jgi:hypothetical protein
MQKLTIFIIGLIFVSCSQVLIKQEKTSNSDSLSEAKVVTKTKAQQTLDSTYRLLDIATAKDTLGFKNSEPFLFFKSGYILSSTEKNAIIIVCPTDTTYSVKLYSIRSKKWELTDSIGELDAFPSQFELTFDDYNFDKQTDIYIQVSASQGWSLSRGHLFTIDPVTKKLTRHKEARDLANMRPDPKTKTVVSELWKGYNDKNQDQLTIFTNKWMNGKLKTIKKKNITLK